jgi:hypothetical protein
MSMKVDERKLRQDQGQLRLVRLNVTAIRT